MTNKELLNIIFTRKNIEQKGWIFDAKIDWKTVNIRIDSDNDNYIVWNNGAWNDGIWEHGRWNNGVWNNGTWKDGLWKNGTWYNGTWESGDWYNGEWSNGLWEKGFWKKGTWITGKIYNPKTRKYQESTLPPNKCPWSTSYEG
jgi:hypothetical protein